MKTKLTHKFEDIISVENLLEAWKEFVRGKRGKPDVQEFFLNLKVFIKTLASGVDFLGWVNFSDHRILRATTKRRMMRRIKENPKEETISSYLGLIKHGNTQELKNLILKDF